jgi:hypothetical protein
MRPPFSFEMILLARLPRGGRLLESRSPWERTPGPYGGAETSLGPGEFSPGGRPVAYRAGATLLSSFAQFEASL